MNFPLTLVVTPSLSLPRWSLVNLRNIYIKLMMARLSSASTAAPNLQKISQPFLRRKISLGSWISQPREQTLSRPFILRWVVQAFHCVGLGAHYSQITGRVITGSSLNDSFVFLDHTVPVWSRSPDTPRLPSSSPGTAGAKLLGHCTWPLSITLPRTVEVATSSGETRECHLPETFLERHTPVSVQYDLTLHISKGKLRSDSQ